MGLSGGADSTLALLVATKVRELNPEFKVLAVHCIHGLDADDPIWLAHCQKLCKRVDVPLVTPKLNIVYGNGVSPEDSSRKERYAALLSNLDKDGYLLLGHQADDQVENFLLALKRGSGPYGLSGMRNLIEDERGRIIRPLLSLNKKTIEEIIEALGFDFVYDISNSYMKFERNFMRLKVLPLLRTRFKGIDKAILRSSKLCAYEHDLAYRYAKEKADECIEGNRLNIQMLDVNDAALATHILRIFLLKYVDMPPDFSLIEDSLKLCSISNDQEGKIVLDETYILRRYLNYLYITKDYTMPSKQSYSLELRDSLKLGSFVYSICPLDEDTLHHKDNSCIFNTDKVVLDFTYTGKMKLKPLKRVHKREIKKLFGEYSIPYFLRGSKPIVKDCDGNILGMGDMFTSKDDNFKYYLKIESV